MEPLPRYWAFVESQVPRRTSSLPPVPVKIWGGSDRSEAAAEHAARERLAAVESRGVPDSAEREQGWYYPAGAVREEVLQEIPADGHTPAGPLLAVITRNRYGAQVLNTDAVMIADVDLPEPAVKRRAGGGLLGLLRRDRSGGGRDSEDDAPEREAQQRIEAFTSAHPEFGVVTQRTHGGFRVFVTGTGTRPGEQRAQALLEELGTDPLYTRLCRAQGTYRARLSPKPWRVRDPEAGFLLRAMDSSWPVQDAEDARRREEWIAAYESASSSYGVCRHLSWNGVHPSTAEQQVLALHDRSVRTQDDVALA